jgi:NAD(P)-dependent dehydrogenase (short-subunit alcohol dehydrogenase family)
MSASLRDQVALVTGASRGLGLAVSIELAKASADLALLARDLKALHDARNLARAARERTTQEIRTYGVDLTHVSEVDAAVSRCIQDFGRVDILINNAAIQGPIGRLEETDWEAWRSAFDVNFFAAARLCQLVLPGMRARGHGKIINISGGGATSARPHVSAYAAAKSALVRLSETLAAELHGTGIDVNSVAPGAMNTRMLAEIVAAGPDRAPGEYERAVAQVESGVTPPGRAAALVVFLASSASDGISGRLISAVWDNWEALADRREQLDRTDIYTLRRIVPEDRGLKW